MSTDAPQDDKSAEKASWANKAKLAGISAGAAIGSAALAAALLYASRRREKVVKPTAPPPHPEHAPETD